MIKDEQSSKISHQASEIFCFELLHLKKFIAECRLRGGGSRYEVTNLDPCQSWSFRLRAPPTIVDGMIQLGSVLWTFEATTAPIPHIQAIAGKGSEL